MAKISVVVNVVKEEIGTLSRALSSVKSLASEIVIVDMSGQSEVKKIAKEFGAQVFSHEFVPYVEPVRNFGISKATGDWILIMDPDEEIPGTLSKKLKSVVSDSKSNFYRIPRKNLVFGKWLKYSRWWPDYNVRFFKKGSVSWGDIIHWVPVTNGDGIDLPVEEDMAITHHHYDSIEQFIERMNRYTTVQSETLVKKGYKFNWFDLVKKPSAEFLSRFFAGEGYKDGVHGLALAGLQSLSELVVYLKVWQSEGFKEESIKLTDFEKVSKEVSGEVNYWKADSRVKSGHGVIYNIKRKFKI